MQNLQLKMEKQEGISSARELCDESRIEKN
jgi:hypothetical protein